MIDAAIRLLIILIMGMIDKLPRVDALYRPLITGRLRWAYRRVLASRARSKAESGAAARPCTSQRPDCLI